MKQEVRGLVRRMDTNAQRFVSDAGIVIGSPASVEPGSKVLNVPATAVARAGHTAVMAGAAGAVGSWAVDAVGHTSFLSGIGELGSSAILVGAGASLVASAPAQPRSHHRILRIPSQKVRRGLLAGSAAMAAANYVSFGAGMGGPHTAIGAVAVAAGVVGYVAGL